MNCSPYQGENPLSSIASGSVSSDNVSTSTGTASDVSSQTESGMNSWQSTLIMLIPLAILILIYVLMSRSQKKKERKQEEIRNGVKVGEDIVTIGGIVGRVVSLKGEDEIIIETGSDRNRTRIKKWAIQTIVSRENDKDAQNKLPAVEKNDEKEDKKADKKKNSGVETPEQKD